MEEEGIKSAGQVVEEEKAKRQNLQSWSFE